MHNFLWPYMNMCVKISLIVLHFRFLFFFRIENKKVSVFDYSHFIWCEWNRLASAYVTDELLVKEREKRIWTMRRNASHTRVTISAKYKLLIFFFLSMFDSLSFVFFLKKINFFCCSHSFSLCYVLCFELNA